VGGWVGGWEGGRERDAAERFEMKGGRRQTPWASRSELGFQGLGFRVWGVGSPWASRSELIDGKNDARSRSSP